MGHKHVDNAVKARFALPRSAYEALQERATKKGQTLSEYLRDLVERDEVGLVGDVGDADGDITPEELRRMGSDAVREISRRLKSGEAAKDADTSLTKYADWLVRTLEEERLERAKSDRTPEQAVEGDDRFTTWLESNRDRIGSQRFKEASAEYVVLLDRALQRARKVLGVDADAEVNAVNRLPAVGEATS
jgi:hypothetical protein